MIRYTKRFQNESVLLLGDMNKSPEDGKNEYDKFRCEGFYDLWQLLHPDDPGYTDRDDPNRIDYIWANDRICPEQIKSIKLIATTPDENGVYASDHFGLIAEIDV